MYQIKLRHLGKPSGFGYFAGVGSVLDLYGSSRYRDQIDVGAFDIGFHTDQAMQYDDFNAAVRHLDIGNEFSVNSLRGWQ